MVNATTETMPYRVRVSAGANACRADTVKDGRGGATGLRPHELLEAALANCIAITARMALEELGLGDTLVDVTVELDRTADATTFAYRIACDPAPSAETWEAVTARVEDSPVRRTLSRPMSFPARR